MRNHRPLHTLSTQPRFTTKCLPVDGLIDCLVDTVIANPNYDVRYAH